MGKDVSDVVRDAVGQVVREAAQSISDGGAAARKRSGGPLGGMRGVAAGAGLVALAPLAAKGAGKVLGDGGVKGVVRKAGSKAGEKVKESVSEKVDQVGGVGGIAKEAGKSLLPGGGDTGGDGVPGVGKGRRMPVQQAMDVAVPVETAYNQWTQFEDWPTFMHRLDNVTQEDDCTVSFKVKMWGMSKEFTAQIETQRPEERIKWSVKEGVTHTGVVTFHELSDRLTRIEVTVDVDPGSLIEKAARGMRHVKRAIRADLHRFKAFVEIQEIETGAWRGVIEDGELVEPHPEGYDEERDYSDVEDAVQGESSGEEDHEPEAEEEEEGGDDQRARSGRFQRQAQSAGRSGARRRSSGNGSHEAPSKPSRPRKPASRR